MTDGLLLLHAFPLDASMWASQIAEFQGDLHVVAPNFPGFGGTAGVDVLRMSDAAEEAARAASTVGVDGVVVCGLSMGGYVALEFWRRYRDRVRGLVLANTRAGADDEAGKDRRRALADRLRSEGNQFLIDEPPPLLSAGAPAVLWEQVKAVIGAQPATAIASASLGMAERPDSTGDLAGIDVPTLVLSSSGDTLIPPEATTPMADQIPGASLELIQTAGHLSNLEAPAEFNRALRAHLERCGLIG